MASKRKQLQEELNFKVLRLLNENPKMTTRAVAQETGVSNGSAYYCINALVQKGMIKLRNFKNHKNKSRYIYKLTPSGIYEKTILTAKFLQTKLNEYENLKKEIKELEEEIYKTKNNINISKDNSS